MLLVTCSPPMAYPAQEVEARIASGQAPEAHWCGHVHCRGAVHAASRHRPQDLRAGAGAGGPLPAAPQQAGQAIASVEAGDALQPAPCASASGTVERDVSGDALPDWTTEPWLLPLQVRAEVCPAGLLGSMIAGCWPAAPPALSPAQSGCQLP